MINLLPPEYKQKKLFGLSKPLLLFIGLVLVLSILVVAFSYTSLVIDEKIAKDKLKIAENKLSDLKTELREIKTLKNKKERVKRQLREKKEILGTKLEMTPILSSLQQIVSNDSWIISFNFKENNSFEFVGYALSNQEVGVLFKKLKAAPKFKDVSINLVKQRELNRKKYSENKIVYYKITGKLVNKGGANNARLE